MNSYNINIVYSIVAVSAVCLSVRYNDEIKLL